MDAFTSPSALIKVVRISFPVPQEAWLFHSRSDGGLCATPASAAHTCIHTVRLTFLRKSLLHCFLLFMKQQLNRHINMRCFILKTLLILATTERTSNDTNRTSGGKLLPLWSLWTINQRNFASTTWRRLISLFMWTNQKTSLIPRRNISNLDNKTVFWGFVFKFNSFQFHVGGTCTHYLDLLLNKIHVMSWTHSLLISTPHRDWLSSFENKLWGKLVNDLIGVIYLSLQPPVTQRVVLQNTRWNKSFHCVVMSQWRCVTGCSTNSGQTRCQ